MNLRTLLPIQRLHFVDGERHKFVEVQIVDDDIPEGPERFQLILSEPSPGLELGTNTTGRRTKSCPTKQTQWKISCKCSIHGQDFR